MKDNRADENRYINLIKKVGVSFTLFRSNKKIQRFSLRKRHSTKNVIKVFMPPELKYNYSSVDMEKFATNGYKLAIRRFVRIMETNFSREDLANFYNNFQSVEVSSKKLGFILLNILLRRNIVGMYNTKDNVIRIDSKYASSIYHELLHMASTIKTNGVYYSGFNQISYEGGEKSFGRGINEGYTEFLAQRYFTDASIKSTAYFYETRIAFHIEDIVGRGKMEKLYLRSNLKGLIDELKRYSSEENVLEFISNMDQFSDYVNDRKLRKKKIKEIEDLFIKINVFVLNTYIAKTKERFYIGEMSIENLSVDFVNFRNSLITSLKIKKLNIDVNRVAACLDNVTSNALCECGESLLDNKVGKGKR